jgi:hypothetical protein
MHLYYSAIFNAMVKTTNNQMNGPSKIKKSRCLPTPDMQRTPTQKTFVEWNRQMPNRTQYIRYECKVIEIEKKIVRRLDGQGRDGNLCNR